MDFEIALHDEEGVLELEVPREVKSLCVLRVGKPLRESRVAELSYNNQLTPCTFDCERLSLSSYPERCG